MNAAFEQGLRDQGFRFTVAQRDYAGDLVLYGYRPPMPRITGVPMRIEDIHTVDVRGRLTVMPTLIVRGL